MTITKCGWPSPGFPWHSPIGLSEMYAVSEGSSDMGRVFETLAEPHQYMARVWPGSKDDESPACDSLDTAVKWLIDRWNRPGAGKPDWYKEAVRNGVVARDAQGVITVVRS